MDPIFNNFWGLDPLPLEVRETYVQRLPATLTLLSYREVNQERLERRPQSTKVLQLSERRPHGGGKDAFPNMVAHLQPTGIRVFLIFPQVERTKHHLAIAKRW